MRWVYGVNWTPGVEEAHGWSVLYADGSWGPAAMAAIETVVEAARLILWVRHGGGTTDCLNPDPRTSPIKWVEGGDLLPSGWNRGGEFSSHEDIWFLLTTCCTEYDTTPD